MRSRAEAVAERFDGCRALMLDELVADPAVDTVLNLTVPSAHADVALAALSHGKHVYGEKPLAARLGVSRKRIADAQTAMSATRDLLARQIGAMEDVDPTEAATRVNDLTARLQATYAVTARMRDLSLLKYL